MSEEQKTHLKEKKTQQKEEYVNLIRIFQKDIRGDRKIYRGLCEIKGISWMFSNLVCIKTGIDRNKKVQELTPEEIKKIETFLANPEGVPHYLTNRRNDRDDGKDKHISGADLDLQVDFDIKRARKLKTFKGIRHGLKLPVRGQRTKSNFRANKKKSGLSKKTPSVTPQKTVKKGGKK